MIFLPNFQERVRRELDEIWTESKFLESGCWEKGGDLFQRGLLQF